MLIFRILIIAALFIQSHAYSCGLVDVITNKVDGRVYVTKNTILFSGAGPETSVQEIDYNNQHALALTQGKNDVKDFETFASSMCAIIGDECKKFEIDGYPVLEMYGDGISTRSFPVFVGGLLVGQEQHTQLTTSKDIECSQPDNSYIKKSVEIFMTTGQKESVLDYLKSIKKIPSEEKKEKNRTTTL